MRIKMLLDIEMGDSPESERQELADIIGQAVTEELQRMFLDIDSSDIQSELLSWISFYGMLKKSHSASQN